MNDFPEPSLQMRMIQRCPNCKRHLVLTEDGKYQECGEQINMSGPEDSSIEPPI